MSLNQILAGSVGGQRAPAAVVATNSGSGETIVACENADPSALFPIGSITKVLTTTLILQHVSEGTVALDDPVVHYLTDFQLQPSNMTSQVTIRHLITHTSGIDCADDFTDTGDGDDALALYVNDCVAGSNMLHSPGAYWSYCNAGFSVLGRIVEVLNDKPWDDSLVARIAKPLGLSLTTAARLRDSQLVTMGHRFDPKTGVLVEEPRLMARGGGPAGSNVVATAEDMVDFARALFAGEILDSHLVDEMTQTNGNPPFGKQGLGWAIPTPGVVSHLGSTRGHSAYLGRSAGGKIVSVVANGPGAASISRAIAPDFFQPHESLTEKSPDKLNLDSFVGHFQRRHVSQTIDKRGDTIVAKTEYTGPISDYFEDADSIELRPIARDTFASKVPYEDLPVIWRFAAFDATGIPSLLMTSNRLHRRNQP